MHVCDECSYTPVPGVPNRDERVAMSSPVLLACSIDSSVPEGSNSIARRAFQASSPICSAATSEGMGGSLGC